MFNSFNRNASVLGHRTWPSNIQITYSIRSRIKHSATRKVQTTTARSPSQPNFRVLSDSLRASACLSSRGRGAADDLINIEPRAGARSNSSCLLGTFRVRFPARVWSLDPALIIYIYVFSLQTSKNGSARGAEAMCEDVPLFFACAPR